VGDTPEAGVPRRGEPARARPHRRSFGASDAVRSPTAGRAPGGRAYYTLSVIGKAGIGSPDMDGNTRLCTATTAAALKASFGTDGQPSSCLGLLRDLHDLYLMACEVDISWTVIGQAAQGARDPELLATVTTCDRDTAIQLAWLRTRMKAAALTETNLPGSSGRHDEGLTVAGQLVVVDRRTARDLLRAGRPPGPEGPGHTTSRGRRRRRRA
jgi:hypothetical protein